MEECDDGNTSPGDGCATTCFVEDGFTCYTHSDSQFIDLGADSFCMPTPQVDIEDAATTSSILTSAIVGITLVTSAVFS